jgi:hypothetical protein
VGAIVVVKVVVCVLEILIEGLYLGQMQTSYFCSFIDGVLSSGQIGATVCSVVSQSHQVLETPTFHRPGCKYQVKAE